jgi:hypothetical protein
MIAVRMKTGTHLNKNMRLTNVTNLIVIYQIFIPPSPPTSKKGGTFFGNVVFVLPMICFSQLDVSK